ncbi:MAG: transferrin-binding protein-like solute binding protein [Boseongicola sp. SB0677_bin_26]|nr:transferrin-binding protein-like solute binding protein [Boseongicola sp. SB0677_bin_26]
MEEKRALAAVTAAFLLASCGGGDGGPTAEDTRALTGSGPPLETAADQLARMAGIVSRSDSVVVSTWYGETSHPEFPAFRIPASCSGTTCTLDDPESGLSLTVEIDEVGFDAALARAVLAKHGITMVDVRDGADRTYASVMNHGWFAVTSGRETLEGVDAWHRISSAAGDLTGFAPGGSATWRGIMAGVPVDASGRGEFLQGDATITYHLSAGSLDAAFTGIRNISRNRDHSVPSVRFEDVHVSADGTFRAGIVGNRIQGGFHGPRHAETAGIFEQRGIVGSFGAKR